jgi:DNA helicase II / ATP-dependent DNA helicase PcrA
MTIHAAKGLEFPYLYVVGLEENLFPNFQAVGTRQDLEEERRLFYVALTRAEKQATISYAKSRLRWGNFTFCEPSRFLAEIDPKFIERPQGAKVTAGIPKPGSGMQKTPDLSRMKRVGTNHSGQIATDPAALNAGMRVKHERFGEGTIKELEGRAADMKATVVFDIAGEKKLLLRFAKLDVIP